MIAREKNLKKQTYTGTEMAKIHNRYRLIMVGMLAIFVWISWYFGVLDDIAKIFGIKINPKDGFFPVIKTLAASILSIFGLIYGFMMAWDKLFKKK